MNNESEVTAITLSELLNMIPDMRKEKLPTLKELRLSHAKMLYSIYGDSFCLCIYNNGYFSYSNGKRTTVQCVHKCQEAIVYESEKSTQVSVGMETFGSLPFVIRLILEGEIRLERNQYGRDLGRLFAYEELLLRNSHYLVDDMLDDVLSAEEMSNALMLLTSSQRQVVHMYFFEGLTQRAIAERLGIKTRSVGNRLQSALKKLHRVLSVQNREC